MTHEKWQNIVGMVKDQFTVEDEGEEELIDIPRARIHWLEFRGGPMGRMRLEYIVKPVVLDKKTIGSRRIGSETAVEYVYSDSEMSHALRAFQWDEAANEWTELAKEKMSFIS